MAEATAMRNNALPYPVYGVAWTVVFPLLDADGDPISPSSPDSERSLNGDTFADCTNEATEIATSTGICYLTLTAAEMTADIVSVRIQSTGAKTTVVVLYPRKLPVLSTGTCQGSNDTGDIQLASGDSAIDDYYNGCLCVAVIDGTTEARVINDYVGSTKVGEVSPAWNTAQPDSNDTYTIYMPEGRAVDQSEVRSWMGTAPAAYSTTRGTSGTALPAVAAESAGGLYTRGTGAGQINQSANGQIDVNAERLNNVAQSLLDLKDFADDGYDPSTNKVQGVVLADTVTTYTGNTPQTGDSFARIGATGSGLTSLAPSATALSTAQWTNARAGYLDNINNATLASAVFPTDPADQSLIIAATNTILADTNAILLDTGTDGVKVASASVTEIQAGLATTANVSAVETKVDTLLTRITATLFSGITSLAQWLGLMAGKQLGNSTARTEIRATGAGSGTFDETAHSLEKLAESSAPSAQTIADTLLDRDMAAGADTNSRSPRNALRLLRNKWDVAGGVLTVKKEDDATTAWTAVISTSSSVDSIVGQDPT